MNHSFHDSRRGRKHFYCHFLAILALASSVHAAGPARGLDALPARPLVFGYLNDLRSTNPPAADIARLDFDAVDIVVHGFAEPKSDGSVGFGLGKVAIYRAPLLDHAHRRGKGVVLSVGGGAPERLRNAFADIAASSVRRKKFAENLLRAVRAWGYDGIDIDYEFPSTSREKDDFTALMRAIQTEFKAASTNYIVMFGVSPGFYIDQFDWPRLAACTDFAFYFGYDWKNPANGPLTHPQAVQWLSGGLEKIEAGSRGALHYMIARGFPPAKIIHGLPFYSTDRDSWPVLREIWATNRLWFSNAVDATFGEVFLSGRWWNTPETIQRKMTALLDADTTILTNRLVLRGIGFWEFGHQSVAQPDLTAAIKDWLAARTNTPPALAPAVPAPSPPAVRAAP